MLQSRTGSAYFESISLVMAHTALPWTQALSVSPFTEAYTCGMRSGNTHFAGWTLLYSAVIVPFQLGKPLAPIASKIDKSVAIMEELNQGE